MKVERHFDSPASFLAQLAQPINTDGPLGGEPASAAEDKKHSGRYWSGTATYHVALELAERGDYKTARAIAPRNVNLIPHSAHHATVYDVAGDIVDVGRYLTGNPECLGSRQRRGRPIVNILVSIAASAHVPPTVIRERGRAILEVMSGLEAAGYGVDITIVNRVHRADAYTYCLMVNVKKAGEYFNLPSLAYWLTNPSVLRRLYFRLLEQEPTEVQVAIGFGYGRATDVPDDELAAMPNCVYFPKVTENDSGNYEDMIQRVTERYGP